MLLLQQPDTLTASAVSAKRVVSPPTDATSGEKLQRSVNLADAIRDFSGIQLRDYGGVGGLKTVNVRSLGSAHTAIFLDGVPIDNAQNMQVDLGRIPTSGLDYLGNEAVKESAVEVGYDAALNYEAILQTRPDLFLTYAVSAAEPPYLAKLKDLGVRCVILSEHLENHPLARAEYVKFFGALTGHPQEADSVFTAVKDRYLSLVQEPSVRKKVLINRDAGGDLLGSEPGKTESGTIGLEQAYAYAQEADLWLNPGWCRTREQLRSVHPLFSRFPVLEKDVWNNTLQTTEGGGNRFWETGPVHPDWILEDLVHIFSATPWDMHYFFPLE